MELISHKRFASNKWRSFITVFTHSTSTYSDKHKWYSHTGGKPPLHDGTTSISAILLTLQV